MSVVTVRTKEVVREWNRRGQRDVEFSLASSSSVEEMLELFGPVTDSLNQQYSSVAFIHPPAPYPQGVVFFVDYCDEVGALQRVLEQIAHAAGGAGIAGRIGPIKSQYSPLSSHRPWGFIAGFSLRGQPSGIVERRPWKVWDTDAVSLTSVVDHALDWCQIVNGDHWISSNLSTFEVEADQRRALLLPPIARDQTAAIVAGRGTKLSREDAQRQSKVYEVEVAKTVVFDRRGHVIYGIGSDGPMDWQQCVEDLTAVIRHLHEHVEYAFIQRRRVTPGLWQELHRDVWLPWIPAHARDVALDRAEERTRVVSAYGIQLLGPGHRPVPSDPRWMIEDLGAGKLLVSDPHLDRWFHDAPTLSLHVDARESFADLLGNSWNPRQADRDSW